MALALTFTSSCGIKFKLNPNDILCLSNPLACTAFSSGSSSSGSGSGMSISWLTQLGAVTYDSGVGTTSAAYVREDACSAVTKDVAGNIYCAGITGGHFGEIKSGPNDTYDVIVIKLNAAGVIQWVKQFGSVTVAPGGDNSQHDEIGGIGVDAAGNIYVGGQTEGSFAEANGGDYDVFFFKLDSTGALLWATQLGAVTSAPGGDNSGYDSCVDFTIDSLGNSYCVGATNGDIGEANGGSNDSFVAKVNTSGVLQWVTQLGATTVGAGGDNASDETVRAITVDSLNNIYVSGSTFSNMGENHSGGGGADSFVYKLNSAGALLWATQLGDTTVAPGGDNLGDDSCQGLATDSSNNVYCTGYTDGDLGEPVAGTQDAFILKLNSAGVLQWLTHLGSVTFTNDNSGHEVGESIAVDSSDDVFIAGITNGDINETNGGSFDTFIAKVSSAGALQWIKHFGNTSTVGGNNLGNDQCSDIAIDSSDNLICAGFTTGSMAETNAGVADVVVIKLNSAGVLQWARQMGTVSTTNITVPYNLAFDECRKMITDSAGNIYCAGITRGHLGEINGNTDNMQDDLFVMKLNSTGVLQWVTQIGATTNISFDGSYINHEVDYFYDIAIDGANNLFLAGTTAPGTSIGETTGGGSDAFVTKINSSGVVQWVTQLGAVTVAPGGNNSANDNARAIAVHASGDIYFAGYTAGSMGEAKGGGFGTIDSYIAKLDSAGALQWVRQLGAVTVAPGGNNTLNDFCWSLAVDAAGNAYCGGMTNGNTAEVLSGASDLFVWKVNSAGVYQWITQLGATTVAPGGNNSGVEQCNSMVVDSSNNIYCVGVTTGDLGEVSTGGYDVFFAKFNTAGVLQWVTQLGGTTVAPGGDNSGSDDCKSAAIDSADNIYCAGYTDGAIGEASGGGEDAFIVKIDSSGALQSVTQLGAVTVAPGGSNAGNDRALGVAIDSSDNVYIGGNSDGSIGEANAGDWDVFISRLTP